MNPSLTSLSFVLLCGFPGTLSAQDLPPLGQVEVITEGLIDTAIAYEIGERCDSIDGRRLQGIAFLWSLETQARRLGYTRQEIQTFIDDDEEKDRLEAIARDRLRAMGAIDGEWDTYCTVGRTEIAKESQVGRLLND